MRVVAAAILSLWFAASGATAQTGVVSGATVTATGSTTPRTLADRAADSVNVLDYGGASGVDRTGAANAAAAFTAAVTDACATKKAVFVPAGTYLIDAYVFIGNIWNCSGLTVWAYPGTAKLLASAANTGNPKFFYGLSQQDITLYGLTFDGNYPTNTNTGSQISFGSPVINLTIEECLFINTAGNAITLNGAQGTLGTTSAQALTGATSFTFSATPAGIKAGSYVVSNFVDSDIYVTSTDATHAYLSKPLTGTVAASTGLRFTGALTTSAAVDVGSTTLLTTDTSGAARGTALVLPDSICLVPDTRVVSLVANTSITIDQALLCTVPSGANIATSSGFPNLQINRNRFEYLGLGQQLAGNLNVTTNGSAASGATTLTFNCVSATCSPSIGLMVGNQTAATGLPAGVPASTPVISGPVINAGASTFQVTLAAPLTGTLPTATVVPFKVRANAGFGYGIWSGYGAWFAHSHIRIEENVFKNWFSTPLYMFGHDVLMRNNRYLANYVGTMNTATAPSACLTVGGIHVVVDGDYCYGTPGYGIEEDHVIGLMIRNSTFTDNALSGAYICGGRDIMIVGSKFARNGKWKTQSSPGGVNDPQHGSGIALGGSCLFTQTGTLSNVVIVGSLFTDDQPTPTQVYGITQLNAGVATVVNLTVADNVFAGNISGTIDPTYPLTMTNTVYGRTVAAGMPASCAGPLPTGTLYNNAGVVNVCP